MACVQNKSLSASGAAQLVEFRNCRGGVWGGSKPLGTFGILSNSRGDRLGRAFPRIFVRRAFDMYLRCCDAGAFFASPAKYEFVQGERCGTSIENTGCVLW